MDIFLVEKDTERNSSAMKNLLRIVVLVAFVIFIDVKAEGDSYEKDESAQELLNVENKDLDDLLDSKVGVFQNCTFNNIWNEQLCGFSFILQFIPNNKPQGFYIYRRNKSLQFSEQVHKGLIITSEPQIYSFAEVKFEYLSSIQHHVSADMDAL